MATNAKRERERAKQSKRLEKEKRKVDREKAVLDGTAGPETFPDSYEDLSAPALPQRQEESPPPPPQ